MLRFPSKFFKIARTIFGVNIFQDFAARFLQNDGFVLQTGRFGRQAQANGYGKHALNKSHNFKKFNYCHAILYSRRTEDSPAKLEMFLCVFKHKSV